MMIWDQFVSGYMSFAVMTFFVSMVGAIVVAALDSTQLEVGRLATQH